MLRQLSAAMLLVTAMRGACQKPQAAPADPDHVGLRFVAAGAPSGSRDGMAVALIYGKSDRQPSLQSLAAYEFVTLAPNRSSTPIHLTGYQQVFFISGGSGEFRSKKEVVSVVEGTGVLVPEGAILTIAALGPSPLKMYVVTESVPDGFHPRSSMLVRDEGRIAYEQGEHRWSYLVKRLFTVDDGLATLTDVSTIELDPLTIGRPMVQPAPALDSIWTTLQGHPLAFVSNQLNPQSAGTSFLEDSSGKIPYSVVNPERDKPVKMLHITQQACCE